MEKTAGKSTGYPQAMGSTVVVAFVPGFLTTPLAWLQMLPKPRNAVIDTTFPLIELTPGFHSIARMTAGLLYGHTFLLGSLQHLLVMFFHVALTLVVGFER